MGFFKFDTSKRVSLAAILVIGLVPSAAISAPVDAQPSSTLSDIAAEQSKMLQSVSETGNLGALRNSEAFNYSDGASALLAAYSMPSRFDLRDFGVVTPVKKQNPWGTCWGFAAVAAAETSILSKLGTTYEQTPLDFSEHQLAWFAQTPLPEGIGAQGGEGNSTFTQDDERMDTGGMPFLATSIFASGIGPIAEDDAPYRNAEGLKVTYRTTHTEEEVTAKQSSNPDYNVDAPLCYSKEGDWSLDESLRFQQAVELEDSSILPCPASRSTDGAYSYNEAGTIAIKGELQKGRAVDVLFCADTSEPGQEDDPVYINTDTWSHYTYKYVGTNHAVTIVGWDDDYSKENFLQGSITDDDGVAYDRCPPQNGAWIVKNSWGASGEDFPNNDDWGVDEDGDGKGDGYFYLSYYDQSLSTPEAFDFYTENLGEGSEYYLVDQHSYMPFSTVNVASAESAVHMANIFTASEDQLVRSLSTNTATPSTTVTFDVYLLDNEAASPTDGTLAASVSETYDYGGFHRAQLAEGVTVKAGERYSVVVTQRSASGLYQTLTCSALGKEGAEAIREIEPNMNSYAVGVVNRGESMLYENGEWVDWADGIEQLYAAAEKKYQEELAQNPYAQDTSHWMVYDNFPIRAYADPWSAPVFSDVVASDWFAPAVSKVADAGLMRGYAGSDEFGVGHALTRAELATILWRDADPADAEAYDGAAENATGMADVAANAFYTAAANWAVANGVIDGVEAEDGSRAFEPDRAVTFEEAVAMIAKYAKATRGTDVDGDAASLDKFADSSAVSDWARGTMAWAVQSGLVNGEPTETGLMIRPASDIMRERAAGVLSNALDLKILG